MQMVDYSDLENLKVTSIKTPRFLHDGGFESTGRYFMDAANALQQDRRDRHQGGTSWLLPWKWARPRTRSWRQLRDPKFVPCWATGHLGDETISLIGTDPVKHKQNAWKVVETLKGAGGGSLFLKSHPKSQNLWWTLALNPDEKISQSIAVFDIKNLDHGFRLLPIAEWANLGKGAKRVLQPQVQQGR